MAWDAFHAKAVAAKPKKELPAKRYYVGVLLHDKSIDQHLVYEDFQWMKARGKVTLEKIFDSYEKFHPGIDVNIRFEDETLEPSTFVRDLNRYRDNMVIFRAEKRIRAPVTLQVKTELRRTPSRQESAKPMPSTPAVLPPVFMPAPDSGVKLERNSPPPFQSSVREPLESFNPDNVFMKDPSPGAEAEPESRPTDVFIRKVIEQQNPELLEAGVKQAYKVLDALHNSFSPHASSSPDADAWVKSIEKLRAQAARKPTIVGVVGNTGAGKSSVINAMLDEERLVPTNCMRACTAVVTEMSWNDITNPLQKYRASIEFITHADWEADLGTLLKDLITDTGTVSRDAANPETEAGIAWAKFHAVYPRMTKDMLSETTVDQLMKHSAVSNILGTTKTINKARAEFFYNELQRYVDSKEKVTKKDKDSAGPEMEYWPLIKVVKIQVKSPALSTGAVIVDLPGVHDSNAARAAVAQGYMKQCTGLWIVAPINRAVDDKAAKTLLGDSFKRQLKYDGGFSSVTFICSKTDDISITEATTSLGLDDKMSGLDGQQRDAERRRDELIEKLADLKKSSDVYYAAINEASDDIELWEELRDKLSDRTTVHAPTKKGNKRKRGASNKKSQKRRQNKDDDDYDGEDDEEDSISIASDEDSDMDGIEPPRTPLTEDDIKAKLEELKNARKLARRERSQIEETRKETRKEILGFKSTIADIQAEMSAICIAGRNDYSKSAIQQDFAAGIKELDMENAEEEDEENFDPDEDLRDYEEVARSLPVFCVSSRAYQKMCGRLERDSKVPGFKTPEETEMPQLQAHCKKLTEAGRVQTCRSSLLSLCSMLNSFSLWSWNDGSGLKMTGDEKRKQVYYLQKRLEELEKGLGEAVRICLNSMKRELSEQIFDKYPEVIHKAAGAAPGVAQGWGAHKDDGGLTWSTYKAVVRRDGVYRSATAGFRDFNSDLIDPITKRLATGWERTFQNRLPKEIELYTKDSSKVLHKFHEKIEERARQNGVGLASLAMLKTQICTYEQQFKDLNILLGSLMTELQRDANRDFTPVIIAIMRDVYARCTDERGPSCFKRMKAFMIEYVTNNKAHMFTTATETVKMHLNKMCRTLEDKMLEESGKIFTSMRGDYMQVLGGVQTSQADKLPKEEKALRAEIKAKLLIVDDQFRSIANGEIEEEEATDGAVTDTPLEETATVENEDETENVFEHSHEDVGESSKDSAATAIMSPTKDDTTTRNTSPTKDGTTTGNTSPTKASSSDDGRKDSEQGWSFSKLSEQPLQTGGHNEEIHASIEKDLRAKFDDEDENMDEEW